MLCIFKTVAEHVADTDQLCAVTSDKIAATNDEELHCQQVRIEILQYGSM